MSEGMTAGTSRVGSGEVGFGWADFAVGAGFCFVGSADGASFCWVGAGFCTVGAKVGISAEPDCKKRQASIVTVIVAQIKDVSRILFVNYSLLLNPFFGNDRPLHDTFMDTAQSNTHHFAIQPSSLQDGLLSRFSTR